MPTIRVMSWNIENLGGSKLNNKEDPTLATQAKGENFMVDYIVAVANDCKPDVIGIMEIVGKVGESLAALIAGKLGDGWYYKVSSMQQSKRYEQSIYLWKKSAYLAEWNPDGLYKPGFTLAELVGIIDDDSMAPFLGNLPPEERTDTYVAKLYDALWQSGYTFRNETIGLEDAYFVDEDKWSDLKNGVPLALTYTAPGEKTSTPLVLTDPQRQLLTDILIRAGIVQFPHIEERCPYLIHLKILGREEHRMSISVHHLPGPGKPKTNSWDKPQSVTTLLPAIANLALCEQFISAVNLLIMGDFNVSKELAENATYQSYKIESSTVDGTTTYSYAKDAEETSMDFFSVLSDAPLGVRDLMGMTVKTSITSQLAEEEIQDFVDSPDTPFDSNTYLVNPYDKFFFKSDGSVTDDKTAKRLDLIEAISPIHTNEVYKQVQAEAAMKFLKFKSYTETGLTFEKLNENGKRRLEGQREERVAKLAKAQENSRISGGTGTSIRRLESAEAELLLTEQEMNDLEQEVWNIRKILGAFKENDLTVPPIPAMAFVAYRSISDHLPIVVDLSVQ